MPSGVGGLWVVRNNTSGGFAVTVDSLAGGAAVTIPAASNTLVTCDGTASGMFLAINTPPAAAGSNTQLQYNNAGVLGASPSLIFDGTILSVTGLYVPGNTTLGVNAGSTLALVGTAIAIPNTVNFGTNTLFLQSTGTKVGIGTATLGSEMLTVAGVIYATAGGFKFPDGTTQTSAATAVAGSNTQVQFNDGGTFGGQANFNFIKGTGTLSVPNLSLSGTLGVTGAATFGSTMSVAGALTVSGGMTAGATGSIDMWPSASIPSRALLCNGASYAATSYPGIFAVIGYTFGGSGANFNVPDLRGRVVAGVDSGAGRLGSGATGGFTGAATLAAVGGEQSHTLTIPEMPSHNHVDANGGNSAGTSFEPSGSTGGAGIVLQSPLTGGGGAHNNVQPTLCLNYIIWM